MLRQSERQLELFEQIENALALISGEAVDFFRKVERSSDAEGNGFAVKHGTVGLGSFYSVANGVAEVEQGARARSFTFVFLYDASLDGEVAC